MLDLLLKTFSPLVNSKFKNFNFGFCQPAQSSLGQINLLGSSSYTSHYSNETAIYLNAQEENKFKNLTTHPSTLIQTLKIFCSKVDSSAYSLCCAILYKSLKHLKVTEYLSIDLIC